MPLPLGAESLASATEETPLAEILKASPEFSRRLKEAQTIILNNCAVTPPKDTPYVRPFASQRRPSVLPYRPRKRVQSVPLPKQMSNRQAQRFLDRCTQFASIQGEAVANGNPSPVVMQQAESLPRSGSTSSENSSDVDLENQIQVKRSSLPEEVSDCARTRQVARAYFNRMKDGCARTRPVDRAYLKRKQPASKDGDDNAGGKRMKASEQPNGREKFGHSYPFPIRFHIHHSCFQGICVYCRFQPSLLILNTFNLKATPREAMNDYTRPNRPWVASSLDKINQLPNMVMHEGAPQAWDLTYLELIPYQIDLSLETLRQFFNYDPALSAFSVVRRTTEELFEHQYSTRLDQLNFYRAIAGYPPVSQLL